MQQKSKFEQVSGLKPAQFKRETFTAMVTILHKAEKQKRKHGGKASKLCVEDRLLLALEYLHDYPTYLRLGQNYGISEGYAFKIHRWVEDTLIKDKRFHLPGRKMLTKSDMEYEVILVDASESPVERPKKDSGATTQARRNATPPKAS
jgi:hypothetical protein